MQLTAHNSLQVFALTVTELQFAVATCIRLSRAERCRSYSATLASAETAGVAIPVGIATRGRHIMLDAPDLSGV